MSLNIRHYKGQPVPYFEFSNEELRHSIKEAKLAIDALSLHGTKRSEQSIKVLRDNINAMRRVMGGAS